MIDYFTNNQPSAVTSNRVLYTPSSFARKSLLYLQEIGELEAKRGHTSSRSGLASYLFFTIISGEGGLVYDNKKYELKPGDCVFIDCEKSYSHTTSSKNLWTLRWIHFYGLGVAGIYDKYCERGGRPVFRPDNIEAFNNIWQEIMNQASGDDYIRDMRINEMLNALMTLTMAESWHPEDQASLPPKKSIIASVKDYLDKHYSEKITLDRLAGQFYINKYYLIKNFKEQYGQSINSYLLNLRITRAKQLLRFSNKSVEEIGLECGLGAAHYFSSKFKEVEGIPPSVYRGRW